jgi:membrane-associated protein
MRAPLVAAIFSDQVEPLLRSFGSVGLMLVVFAETGLTTGFFLPGDSALFVAGFLSWQGVLINVWPLSLGCFVAAVVGDQVGYATGRRLGPALFRRPDSLVFRSSRLREAEWFFERRGAMAVIVARWLPVARTLVPMAAGASRMPYREFVRANVLGAAVWVFGLTQAGWWLGRTWPGLGNRLEWVTLAIVVASTVPVVWHALARRRRAGTLAEMP